MPNSQAMNIFYDAPMWASIREHGWKLQQCDDCDQHRYPPAPVCPQCLSMKAT